MNSLGWKEGMVAAPLCTRLYYEEAREEWDANV